MSNYISTFLIHAIVPVILVLMVSLSKNTDTNDYTATYPKFMSIVGLLDILCVLIALFGILYYKEYKQYKMYANIFFGIILIIMFLIGLYCILAAKNIKIELSKENIIYTNIFGRRKMYEYSQISEIRIYYLSKSRSIEKFIIILNNNRVEVNMLMINFAKSFEFLKRILKKKKLFHRIKITEKRPEKRFFMK